MSKLLFHQVSEFYKKNEYEEGKKYLDSIDINKLKKHQKKPYYTLLLNYYFYVNDIDNINNIIMNYELMKRDYLNYCNYYQNKELVIKIFNEKIKYKEQLLEKDINFLIDNKLDFLLKELDGYFINCSKENNFNDYKILKKYNLENKDKILEYYENLIPKSYINIMRKKLHNIDIIIDGGNISYFGIKNKSDIYINVKIIMDNVMNYKGGKYKNPLIIFNEQHNTAKQNNIIYLINNYNVVFTPKNIYDDFFIIYGIIYNDIPVLTNDKFKDHIYDMFKLFDSKNNNVKNYFDEKIINYTYNKIFDINSYSKCIQIINNNIYIPCKNGFYIYN
jgi:hypothetical protein